MPVPVQNPRAATALQKQFNFVGRFRPQLDETIVAVAIVADVSEEQSPPIVRRATAFGTQGAVVGERSFIRMETPPGVFARIESITLQATGIVRFNFGAALAAPSTLITTFGFVDGRLREAGETPGARFATDTVVGGIVPAVYSITIGANSGNTGRDRIFPNWVIGRQSAVDFMEFGLNSDNIAFTWACQWVELLSFA